MSIDPVSDSEIEASTFIESTVTTTLTLEQERVEQSVLTIDTTNSGKFVHRMHVGPSEITSNLT